jgi:hypothetical protein
MVIVLVISLVCGFVFFTGGILGFSLDLAIIIFFDCWMAVEMLEKLRL